MHSGSEFIDRRDTLFGRANDIEHLLQRARHKGVTAVAARPRMGKSWLLLETARTLTKDSDPPYLVGYVESQGEGTDLFLRAVADLYSRWLSDAGMREQAKMVIEQQKENFSSPAGGAVITIAKELGKLGAAALPFGTILNALVGANEDLKTAELALKPLQYEQAFDIVSTVARISKKPIVLILDQWEKSPSAKTEANLLDSFLRHLPEWPPCHIFLGLRPDETPIELAKDLEQGWRGPAEVFSLGLLKLDDADGSRLASSIRNKVPAAKEQGDDKLLGLVDGYPGVIDQWTGEYHIKHMKTPDDLAARAEDAQAYRFTELDDILPKLKNEERKLAIRLVHLPLVSTEMWDSLKEVILDGDRLERLDDLKTRNVLETVSPPDFGHAKRWEAISQWVQREWQLMVTKETKALILTLAGRVTAIVPENFPFSAALAGLLPTAKTLNLPNLSKTLCQISASFFGNKGTVNSGSLLQTSNVVRERNLSSLSPLIAMGLVNTLILAKEEDNLPRRDALLDELRSLHRHFPDDDPVRKNISMGLFNTLNAAKRENDLPRRNALLDELRKLHQQFPDDPPVGERLTKGLFNTLVDAKEENDLPRRDALLNELRSLHRHFPDDAMIQKTLAMGLVNTCNHAKEESDLPRRDALLEELRNLHQQFPDDAPVREQLAQGLFNTLNAAKEENDLPHRNALLEELRGLHRHFPDDDPVRKHLAKSLFNTLVDAKEENDLPRRDALLEELRSLHQQFPDDAAIRENLSMGLFSTLVNAKEENDLPRRDTLLEELRQEAYKDPPILEVTNILIKGLFICLVGAAEEGQGELVKSLEKEIRPLIETMPDSPQKQEFLTWLENMREDNDE